MAASFDPALALEWGTAMGEEFWGKGTNIQEGRCNLRRRRNLEVLRVQLSCGLRLERFEGGLHLRGLLLLDAEERGNSMRRARECIRDDLIATLSKVPRKEAVR